MPMNVMCINNGDCENTLSVNCLYRVHDHSATGWQIVNDLGELIWVGSSNFRLI